MLWDDRLEALTERHHVELTLPAWCETSDMMNRLETAETAGMILVLDRGWMTRLTTTLCRNVLATGRRVYLYWPMEQAIECLDTERLSTLGRLRFARR